MKLKELAAKPKLVQVLLDDEATVKEYGDALEFWVWDRQPLTKFIKFANAQGQVENFGELVDFCSELILDDEGNPVMVDGEVLPASIMLKCVNKVVEQLGK